MGNNDTFSRTISVGNNNIDAILTEHLAENMVIIYNYKLKRLFMVSGLVYLRTAGALLSWTCRIYDS